MSVSNKKILVIGHGHPDINKGGAELASYRMYRSYREQGMEAWFLARTAMVPHGGAAFSLRDEGREILFHTSMDDSFLFSNIKTRHLWVDFRQLLEQIRPDVVHLHHYIFLGIEMLQIIRNTLPDCRIVVTLHEYLAICHNAGQMITTEARPKLCYKASATDCHRCFPKKSPADFYLRKRYLQGMFELVDQFISPSHFLKQRYVDWGIEESRITVIENGQEAVDPAAFGSYESEEPRIHFGYFGQVNPFKGLHVLLEAIDHLPKKLRKRIHIDIHGANLDIQVSDYKLKIEKLFQHHEKVVTFHGGYEQSELPEIMKSVDWLVMTSIWWENSPMVIQEAFSHRRPVIVPDIGGMVEKVSDGVTGYHYRVGKPAALAQVMERIILNPALRDQLSANIAAPLNLEQAATKTLSLY